jgi:putative tryptophan/tyrosine transport system substrate-binding protein
VTRRLSRRAFITSAAALATGSAIAVVPRDSHAQQPASPRRIGVLLALFSQESKEAQAFRQGLRNAGYVEGRDVVIEWRSAGGDYALVPGLVADLVQREVDVIVVDTTVATRAAKRATSTIPIVMATIADPVGTGLVASLAHPGGNVTGLSVMTTDLSAKRLQLLKEMIPRLTRVAVLRNPDTPYHPKAIEEIKAVAPSLSIQLSLVAARTSADFSAAFSALRRAQAEALYVIIDPYFFNHRTTLLALASKARLPVIYGEKNFVEAGALMSYGPDFGNMFRQSAEYVYKIFKGAKPADLPVEQPQKYEFAINLKTAKALGIMVPESMLLRADEVIR